MEISIGITLKALAGGWILFGEPSDGAKRTKRWVACVGTIGSARDYRRRRGRDSNPRYPFEYTHFPGVLLQPLGHLSR